MSGRNEEPGAKLRGFLSRHERRRPPGVLAACLTLAWRAMLKIKHVPFQMFDVTIMPIMFTLLFTFIFGGALAGSPADYVQFLLPGILVQTVVFITVYTGVGLNTDIQKGLFDRFRSLPMWQAAPLVGALLGDIFRYSVASTVILIIGLILGFRPQGGLAGVLAAFALVLVFSSSLSWIWIIFAMKVQTPESVMTTSFIFLMPVTFASNIFVELQTMPDWLQVVVGNNPVTHLATAARSLMHGEGDWTAIVWVLAYSALIQLVAVPIAIYMYRKER
ncbi:MAG: ABC transporter permease [Spirochaetales bacterium]|nr:ABC transporter permease [Leptospiraceae bacterium]MCP5480402.1 ABC transporter permease [Spirochaetales bacterium]